MKDTLSYLRIFEDKNSSKILRKLLEPKEIEELVKETKLEKQIVTKILKSLEKSILVKKQGEKLVLTATGIKILRKIQGMEFLALNSNYFLTHYFYEMPIFLLQRIDEFAQCKIIHSIWPVSQQMRNIAENSTRYINCIFSEPHIQLADPLYEKINSGIKIQVLFGKNSSFPDCNELVEKLELNKPKSNPMFEKRICDKVITNVLISDNGACLMLGRNDEKFDMINAIVGNDENFIRWCNDFFNFKWTQGESFSRLRNQISV